MNATVAPYNLNEEEEKKLILREYRALLRALKTRIKRGDKTLLRRAFEMAVDAHMDMRRKSGEPYILHPIAVARIVVEEIGLGIRSTICALLHDVVEDTEISLEDIESEFGSQLAKIIDGLTKISNWSATLYLFDNVYHVPDLSPTLAAYLSTLVEIVCPVLLVFGIMSRLAAIPMLVTTAVIQFTFLKSIDHTYWAILLGMILVNGPGPLSVDCFLKKKLSSIKRR
jgi:uncharacterized membrane protein YphA (DoxX/SURF4 family)